MKLTQILYFILITVGLCYSIVMLVIAIADYNSDCFYKSFWIGLLTLVTMTIVEYKMDRY